MRVLIAVSREWAHDLGRNVMMWLMVALPTGLAWAVLHTGPPMPLSPVWLVFAQLMTGLLLASGHWLEEREQGTWAPLQLGAVAIGWLIAVQTLLVTVLALASEVLVFAVNHGALAWTLPLIVAMVGSGLPATLIGVAIGMASPSSRAGHMLATVVMLVLFLATLTAANFSRAPLLHALLHGLPSLLAATALHAGFAGHYAPPSADLGLLGWILGLGALVGWILRWTYVSGR